MKMLEKIKDFFRLNCEVIGHSSAPEDVELLNQILHDMRLAWTYPFENEIIPPQKKDEIIKNIQESLRFMNIQYEIVK